MKKSILTLSLIATLFSCGSKENKNAIKGIQPVDVYMNCDKQGFTTEKIRSEAGTTWSSTKKVGNYSYQIETFTTDVSFVENVRATAMIPVTEDIQNAKDFFKFASSIPYDNSNPEEVAKWLDENFDVNEAEIIVGGVKFILMVPSDQVRILKMTKS